MQEHPERFNPFPGLRTFEPDEDHLFFGRDEQVDELLVRLGRTRFLAVVGASGSGKSSLVRSGLIPSLYSGYMTKAGSSWRVAIFRPGEDPIGNLAAALNDPGVLGGEAEDAEMNRALLEATLSRSAKGLGECVRQARLPEHDSVLVLADQFEELFRFKDNRRIKDSREAALAFVKLLLEGARQEDVPVYVVLTMRSDFIGNCTELPGLVEAINQGQYLVPRMTREERRQAIEGPVAVGGGEIAPRLVTRLLNDVGDDPDQLPILQHALMRSWDYWEGNHTDGEPLDLRHYEAVGTLKEALSLHAEEAFLELEGESAAVTCERLFKALTDKGSDSRGIRRPVCLEEACEITGAGEREVIEVVECFRKPGRSFLMPSHPEPLHADSILDISHESLMRTWRRLIQWVDAEARSAQIYLRLGESAARYQEGKAALYRDPELQLALNWRDEVKPTSAWAERYDPAYERAMLFLEYSEKDRERELAEKERQRQRQLRWARRLAVVLGSAALLTLFFGLYAVTQKVEADQQRDEAQAARQEAEKNAEEAKNNAEKARENAEEAKKNAEEAKSNAEKAFLEQERAERQKQLALEQKQRAETQEQIATEQRRLAEQKEAEARRLQSEAEAAEAEAVEQRKIAVESEAEARRLSMLSLARALALQSTRLRQEQEGQVALLLAVEAYRFQVANGGPPDDSSIHNALRVALDRLRPERRRIFRQHGDAVRAVALSPDGSWLASGSDDGTVRVLDLGRGEGRVVADLGREVRALAVAGSGKIAAGGLGGKVYLLDSPAGDGQRVLRNLDGAVTALSFGGEGRWLAAASSKGKVGLWDLEDRETAVVWLDGLSVPALSVAFRPDGSQLAAGSSDGVAVWDPGRTEEAPLRLAAGREIRSVGWSAGGKALAAGSASGSVLVWHLAGGRFEGPQELVGHLSAVSSVAFGASPDLVASGSLDGSVRLWDLGRPDAEPIVFPDPEAWVWSVALTADGATVAAGSADRTVRAWHTRSAPLAEEACRVLSRDLTREEWDEYLPADVEYESTCPNLEKGPNR